MQTWRGILERWEESAAWIGADECGDAIFQQYQRSLDWNLYESAVDAQLLKQDEKQLFSLLQSMEI